MQINQLFRNFKRKLVAENTLRALVLAIMSAACGVFLLSLVFHILIKQTPWLLTALVGCGVFTVSFLAVFIAGYPGKKQTAARIDQLGLKERASTMLAFQDADTQMAKLQRKDAVEHIQKTSPKAMKLHIRKKECLACLVSLCLASTMLVLPFDVFAFDGPEPTKEQAHQEMIRELITQLREEVKEAELEEQMREALEKIVDELEKDLQSAESELEQAGQIRQAIEQMREVMEEALTKDKIGEALQNYPLTRYLGEAICAGDREMIADALAELEGKLAADTSLIQELSKAITSALNDSMVSEDDALYVALGELSYTIVLLDITSEKYPEYLHAVFEDAKEAIFAALSRQSSIREQMDRMEEAMGQTRDEILGREEQEQSREEATGEGQQGQEPSDQQGQQEGQRPEGDPPEGGNMPEGMGGENPGEGEGTQKTMTEGIYDPVSGNVSYGEVFALYYAEYLEALEKGEVSEELQQIMDRYFAALE